MRRSLLIILVFCASLVWLCSCSKVRKPKTNWQPTLKRDGKNPYDTYLGFQSLWYYFPDAEVRTLYSNFRFEELDRHDWSVGQGKSLFILVGKSLSFNESEWSAIKDYMRRGNEVVLLSSHIEERILDQLFLHQKPGREYSPLSKRNSGEQNRNALSLHAFPGQRFGFRGRDIKGYFSANKHGDSTFADMREMIAADDGRVVGSVHYSTDSFSAPNVMRFAIGKGHLTLVATPLVLSNYFLLQEQNRPYLDGLWQSVPGDIRHIYWGNYEDRSPADSSFSILWRNKATRMALILVFMAALMYLLFEIKRRQRIIPVIPPVVNTSAAFIETVGLLYYNKGDNLNLAQKMEQHFLDWVRNKLHLSTSTLDDAFALQLSAKAGVSPGHARHLLSLLHQLHLDYSSVSNEFLFDFYHTIQEFYTVNGYGIRK